MSAARQTGMLLAIIVALAAFFWQTTACYAEHAGLVPSHEQAGDPAASDAGEGDCCHLEPNAAPGQTFSSARWIFQEARYDSRNFGAPDGPVSEIDYPPQVRA